MNEIITEDIEDSLDQASDKNDLRISAPMSNEYLVNSSRSSGQISNINVNIDVDPSMDPEKLEKLLKLLKNYGAI